MQQYVYRNKVYLLADYITITLCVNRAENRNFFLIPHTPNMKGAFLNTLERRECRCRW